MLLEAPALTFKISSLCMLEAGESFRFSYCFQKKKKTYEISINSFTKVALIEKKKDQTGRSKPVQAPDVEVGRCWLFASPAGKEHWLPRRQGSNQEGPFVFNQPGDFVPGYSFVLELGRGHTGISASWSPVLSREFKWQQVVPQPGP